MAKSNMGKTKSPAYHGISNAKFAPAESGGGYSEDIIKMMYSKSITLSARLERQEVNADNVVVMAVPSDQGYEGSYGTTAQDLDFELVAGLAMEFKNGLAVTKQNAYRKGAFYYEFIEHDPDTNNAYAVKVWLYGVEIGKPDINNETDTNTLTIGAYSYPLRVNGMPLLNDKKEPITDDRGNPLHVMLMRSLPYMEDYEGFGSKVAIPDPKLPEEEEVPEV